MSHRFLATDGKCSDKKKRKTWCCRTFRLFCSWSCFSGRFQRQKSKQHVLSTWEQLVRVASWGRGMSRAIDLFIQQAKTPNQTWNYAQGTDSFIYAEYPTLVMLSVTDFAHQSHEMLWNIQIMTIQWILWRCSLKILACDDKTEEPQWTSDWLRLSSTFGAKRVSMSLPCTCSVFSTVSFSSQRHSDRI